jgi:hypothetical protein
MEAILRPGGQVSLQYNTLIITGYEMAHISYSNLFISAHSHSAVAAHWHWS